MKMLFKSISLLIIVSFCQNCSFFCEKGRGTIKTETRKLTEFDKLEIEGQAEIYLVQGMEPAVKVSIDSNLLEFVKTEVSGKKLKIYESKCLEEISEFKIYLTANMISDLSVNGAVKIWCDSLFRSDEMEIEASNSGEIRLNLEVENLNIITKGSGLVKMTGRTSNLNIDLKSAGSVDAADMLAKNVKFDVTGAGTCEVNVSEKLSGEVSGSGKLFYKGNPKKVETNNTGTGSIRTKL